MRLKDNKQTRVLYRENLEITSKQWLDMLEDDTIFKDKNISLMLALYQCNSYREKASVLAKNMGISRHSVLNSQIGWLGKRIMSKFPHIKFPTSEDGKIEYWHIPFWAEDAEIKGQYYWELRPELKEAIRLLMSSSKREMLELSEEFPIAQELAEKQIDELYEGAKKQIIVNAYERNGKARQLCINEYGYKCCICDFDFEEVYGDIGFQYIEVHHLKPLHKVDREYQIDPINDLRPICPNCHAMLHRANLSCEELKNRLKQKK